MATPRTLHPSQLFPDVNEAIKRREGLMLDYDELRTKVKKLVQTPSQDPTKLPMVSTEKKKSKPRGTGWGLGVWVQGLGFRVYGLGLRV